MTAIFAMGLGRFTPPFGVGFYAGALSVPRHRRRPRTLRAM